VIPHQLRPAASVVDVQKLAFKRPLGSALQVADLICLTTLPRHGNLLHLTGLQVGGFTGPIRRGVVEVQFYWTTKRQVMTSA
jgi:hypothetical protein